MSTNEQTSTTPAENVPAESTPTESTPVESTPAESTPVESTPTENVPAESTPTESTPAENTPTQPSRPTRPIPAFLALSSLSKAGVSALGLEPNFSDVLESYTTKPSTIDNGKLENLITALRVAIANNVLADQRLFHSMKVFVKTFQRSADIPSTVTISLLTEVIALIDEFLDKNVRNIFFEFKMDITFTNIVPLQGTLTTIGTGIVIPRYGVYNLKASLQSSDGSGDASISLTNGADTIVVPPSYSTGSETATSKVRRWIIDCRRTSSSPPQLMVEVSFTGVVNNVLFTLTEK